MSATMQQHTQWFYQSKIIHNKMIIISEWISEQKWAVFFCKNNMYHSNFASLKTMVVVEFWLLINCDKNDMLPSIIFDFFIKELHNFLHFCTCCNSFMMCILPSPIFSCPAPSLGFQCCGGSAEIVFSVLVIWHATFLVYC